MENQQSIWESFQAFRESVVPDRVARGLYDVDFSVWIIVATGLGALTLWTYWRCFVEVRRRELEDEARESVLRAMSPDPDADESEPGGEAHTLRFRVWALETRLRSALDAARSGAPLSAEALAEGLEDVLESDASAGDDGAPAEAISALKYRNWRLETRLAQLEDAGAAQAEVEIDEFYAADDDAEQTVAALQARSGRLEGWLRRLITAAKLGDAAIVADVEAEMAADEGGAFGSEDAATASLMARIETLESEKASLEDQASALRYRRWLLSRRLGDAVEAARAGAPLAVGALMADLAKDEEEPRFGETGANAFMGAAPGSQAPDAAETAELRRRVAMQEAELGRLRTVAGSEAEGATAKEAASLRYRLWLAQAELRRLRDADVGAAATSGEQDRLRGLLAVAQDKLGRVQTEMAQAKAAAAAARPLETGHAATRVAARARTARLTSKLWVAERRLAERDSRDAVADAELFAELDAARARLKRYEESDRSASGAQEAETLRSRLALAQAETERLKGELEAVNRRPKTTDPGLALAAIRAAQAASGVGEDYTLTSGRVSALTPRSPLDRPAPSTPAASPPLSVAAEDSDPQFGAEPGAPLDESHLAARAALAEAIGSPRRGVEDAARELFESGRVVAVGSNRPKNLTDEPPENQTDDLTLIAGVSPRLEAQMNRFGLHFFRQIAEFAPFDLAWLDDKLGLRGAVVRDRWLPQADLLAQMRRDGRLALTADGKFGRLSAKAAAGSAAGGGAQSAEETIDSLPPHPASVDIDFPLTGAELAALDLLRTHSGSDDGAEAPASFSRQPFAEDDDLDDLKAIRGVGPKLEAALRTLGVGRYRQIAVLSPGEAAWLDRRLGLGGRVLRDRWLPQAQALAERSEAARRAAEDGIVADNGAETGRNDLRLTVTPAAGGSALDDVERRAQELILARAATGAMKDRPASARSNPIGQGDDLKLIRRLDAALEARVKALGFHTFAQLAGFSAEDVAWLDAALNLNGRMLSEGWLRQARRLADRKSAGELVLGQEGVWTLPDPAQDGAAALDSALRSPLSPVEREAMRLIDEGLGAHSPRPATLLPGPTTAAPDELQRIEGINATLEQLLNDIGVYYYGQLTAFSAEDLAWLDAKLSFRGRVVRDRWASQAAALERLKVKG